MIASKLAMAINHAIRGLPYRVIHYNDHFDLGRFHRYSI